MESVDGGEMEMTKQTMSVFAEPGADSGIFFDDLTQAIVTWVALQSKMLPPTIAEASDVFNVEPAVIRKAVENSCWAFIDGDGDAPNDATDTIELDGE